LPSGTADTAAWSRPWPTSIWTTACDLVEPVTPLALVNFQGQFGVNVPAVAASVTLTTIPIVVLYAIGRRQLLSGLTAGFGK